MNSRTQIGAAFALGVVLALSSQPAAAASAATGWESAAGAQNEMVFVATGDSIINRRLSTSSLPGVDKMFGVIRKADVAFTNFETQIHDFNLAGAQQSGGTYMGSPRFVTDELAWAGFVYLNVGSGLGAGIVLHGQLHRGARGAAGEVGFLPVGDDPFGAAGGVHAGAMESSLSSRGLIDVAERLAPTTDTSVPAPFDVRALFDAARAGDELGRAVVKHAAREIAVCVAGVMSVVDVELVLLGGGIGASAELLIPDVRRSVAQLLPAPPRVERATLAERGVLAGAVAVALQDARHTMLRRYVTASDP